MARIYNAVPRPNVPVVDLKTGLMTTDWYDYLNSLQLLDLADVSKVPPVAGSVLVWNATTNKWEPTPRGQLGAQATITYGPSMTPDASAGDEQIITATNGTAFTINAPTNPASGQVLTFTIRNASGGALGVVTWNAIFKMPAFTSPANGNSRSVNFFYNGTNWIQRWQSAADVPN